MRQCNSHNPSYNICDNGDVNVTNNETTSNDDFALGDLDDGAFDDRYINEFLSTSWFLNTPMQHGYDSESSISGSTSSNNRICTLYSPQHQPCPSDS